jgi:hypothetical protein
MVGLAVLFCSPLQATPGPTLLRFDRILARILLLKTVTS